MHATTSRMRRWALGIVAGLLLAGAGLGRSDLWLGAAPDAGREADAAARASASESRVDGPDDPDPDTTPASGPDDTQAAGANEPAPATGLPRFDRRDAEALALAVHEAASQLLVPQAGAPVPAPPSLLISGLAAPLYAASLPQDERIFVVERAGLIRILHAGALRATPFLDIRTKVGVAGEGGLLGLAFAPDFATSGLFYVYYTDTLGDSVLSRFSVGGDPNVASAGSEEGLLQVDQPFGNHNGGTIAFSPVDGFLYVGLGDGGDAHDPADRAQNGATLLGKMLRIDVSGGAGTPYSVPAGNPFTANAAVLDEIWSFGLRNPYRFSFDSLTGDLWIGDVGQDLREEIDFEPAGSGGRNYEWDAREGFALNASGSSTPTIGALTPPELDYPHAGGGCSGSVTGGIVYRGPEAALVGEYFFGDYCTGAMWSYDEPSSTLTSRTAELAPASGGRTTAIVDDGFGALLIARIDGALYRLGASGNECANGIDDDGDGAADFGSDPGCSSAADPSERNPDAACDDGFDNDRDGDVDFPADFTCPNASSDAEIPVDPGGGGGGGGSSGSCGLGFELVLLVPALRWVRRRRA